MNASVKNKPRCPYNKTPIGSSFHNMKNSNLYRFNTDTERYSLAYARLPNQLFEYQMRITFRCATFYYFVLDTNDLFSCLCFPFSANIIGSVMFPEKTKDDFYFVVLVKAVECITKISRTLYQKTGIFHNMLNFGPRLGSRREFSYLLLKCFVVSFFAYIDKHGVSEMEPLIPFIGVMIKNVSNCSYFRKPLKELKQFLAENFNIHCEIINDPFSKDEKVIDMSLLQSVYHQIGQQKHLEIAIFFKSLWQEIRQYHGKSFLMKQFYTLKFVDVIEKMSLDLNTVELTNLDNIFRPFIKLKTNVEFNEFVSIVIPIDHLPKVIEKVFELMNYLHSKLNELTKSMLSNFALFCNDFLHFMHFYLKYSINIEFRKCKIEETGIDQLIKAVSELKKYVEHFPRLLTMRNEVRSMNGDKIQQLTDTLPLLDIFTEPHVFSKEIQKANQIFNAFEDIGHNNLMKVLSSRNLSFFINDGYYKNNCRKSLSLSRSTIFINRMTNILNKTLDQQTEEETKYVNDHIPVFHYFYSHVYFTELYQQTNEKHKILRYLLQHCRESQKVFHYPIFIKLPLK